jgi:hypothetical protein
VTRVSQPRALAAPGDIRADNPKVAALQTGRLDQGLGQHVEVTALAAEAMDAHHQIGSVSPAPLPPGHAVRTRRALAQQVAQLGVAEQGIGSGIGHQKQEGKTAILAGSLFKLTGKRGRKPPQFAGSPDRTG